MKQIYIYLGIICLLCTPAHAATKCVALNASSTCTKRSNPSLSDWNATCSNIPVKGIGVCSSTPGSTAGQTADTLETAYNADENGYCWCKMVSPAVSRWVFNYYGTTTSCMPYCAHSCARYTETNSAFRAGLFSNMQ